MGYSFQLAARVLLYASSHSQDSTYHGLCYTSRGALVGIMVQCDAESLGSTPVGETHGAMSSNCMFRDDLTTR